MLLHFEEMDGGTQLALCNIGESFALSDLAAMRAQALAELQRDDRNIKAFAPVLPSLYRRMVWPDEPIDPEELLAFTEMSSHAHWLHRSQYVWASAFLDGRELSGSDWVDTMRAMIRMDDPEGYVAAHAAGGLAALTERGIEPPGMASLVEEVSASMIEHLTEPFSPTDAAVECVAGLELLNRFDLVKPEWIDSIREAQTPDGSWERDGYGDWHTTVLATLALALASDPTAGGPFFA